MSLILLPYAFVLNKDLISPNKNLCVIIFVKIRF